MSIVRQSLRQLAQDAATDGQVAGWDNAGGIWKPVNAVRSITAGTNVTVDNTDPLHPVVAAPLAGGTFVGCKAVLSSSAALTTGVARTVPLDGTDVYDTNSIHDPASNNTRLTIPSGKGGVWRFTLSGTFTASTVGYRMIFPYVNGAAQNERVSIGPNPNGGSTTILTMSVDLNLLATDYVEMGAFVNTTGLSVTAASMSAHYLG